MKVAVLDLGSNSFRLLVAEVDPSGHLDVILRDRELLHLGSRVARDSVIAGPSLARALAAVQQLNDLALRTGAEEVHVLATSAIRSAENRDEVVSALGEVAGREIRVLDGLEEAGLSFLGASASVMLPAGNNAVLDLGGGSLDLALGAGREPTWAESVPLGVDRMRGLFEREQSLAGVDLKAVRSEVRQQLEPSTKVLADAGVHQVVAVGGPVRALARLAGNRRPGWYPDFLNQLTVTRDEVDALAAMVASMSVTERLADGGIKASRAAELPTALAIISEVMSVFDQESLTIGYWGLREGVIIEAYGMERLPIGDAMRAASIEGLQQRFVSDLAHSRHVAMLAGRLFDSIASTEGLNNRDRQLVVEAAHLHAIGQSVSFKGYQRHGAYLIEHAELRGISPEEVRDLASIVRFHVSGHPKSSYLPFGGLPDGDQARVAKLAVLLHMADLLDRSVDQAVESAEITAFEDRWVLRFEGEAPGLQPERVEHLEWAVRGAFGAHLTVEY